MEQQLPAIVIIAFNRPLCLERLLSSIDKADMTGYTGVALCISIDRSEQFSTVAEIAERFSWRYGEKIILSNTQHLGLRDHVLACGDLSEEFGSVVLLEDDLYVSPCFYRYAVDALEFYRKDNRVAGVALYSPGLNETSGTSFVPLDDGTDVYFSQVPCSWGVAFPANHWGSFRKWYASNECRANFPTTLPPDAIAWPDTSWKKSHFEYLIQSGQLIVYPRRSLTTNFGDSGTHFARPTRRFQVPLQMRWGETRFSKFDDSLAVYDSHWELMPDKLTQVCDILRPYRFSVDLYRTKRLECVETEYLLTTRPPDRFLYRFSREMVPLERNVIENIAGSGIWFCRTIDVTQVGDKAQDACDSISDSLPGLHPIVHDLLQELSSMKSSKSWKITAPLRRLRKYLSR